MPIKETKKELFIEQLAKFLVENKDANSYAHAAEALYVRTGHIKPGLAHGWSMLLVTSPVTPGMTTEEATKVLTEFLS